MARKGVREEVATRPEDQNRGREARSTIPDTKDKELER